MSYFEDFIADHVADEDMEYLQIEHEANKGIWTTASGEKLHISAMETKHINNAIKLLGRQGGFKDCYLPWIYVLTKELERRKKTAEQQHTYRKLKRAVAVEVGDAHFKLSSENYPWYSEEVFPTNMEKIVKMDNPFGGWYKYEEEEKYICD